MSRKKDKHVITVAGSWRGSSSEVIPPYPQRSLLPPGTMDQCTQDPHMYSSFIPSSNSASNKISEPASPATAGPTSQNPNAQLTMNLLNNLLQMQGLENSIVQQQMSSSASSSQSTSINPTNPTSSPNPFPSNIMLEQQIKLTQLQQLQQLQNQIFQQQIALISGQSPPVLAAPPLFDASRQLAGTSGSMGDQHDYTGLPTPGPSGEIRPQRPQEFVSPSGLANYLEPLPHALVPPPSNRDVHSLNSPSRNLTASTSNHHRHGSAPGPLSLDLQRQLMALSQPGGNMSQRSQHNHYTQHPGSPNAFSHQQHHPTSPMSSHPPTINHGMSPHPFKSDMRDHPLPRPYHQHFGTPNQHPFHVSPSMQPGITHSAPAHVAFNIFNGSSSAGEGGANIPGLTLGPADAPVIPGEYHKQRFSMSESPRYAVHHHQVQPMPILDQDISPLTSPWLGAHSTSSSASTSSARHRGANAAGSKRMASSSGDEGGSARKKHSPAIRPTIGMSISRIVSERSRENGSTSPLGPSRKGSTPPLATTSTSHSGGRTEPPSAGLRSLSGSVSPAPNGTQPGLMNGNDAGAGKEGFAHDATRPRRESKSTGSTPLLRSTHTSTMGKNTIRPTRSRSKAQIAGGASGDVHAADGLQDSPSPVDLNREVDGSVNRSMPPPPLPTSSTGSRSNINGPSSIPDANAGGNIAEAEQVNRNEGMGNAGSGMSMEVDMLGDMMNMEGMNSMGGMELGNMGFGGMGMGEMDSIIGMDTMNGMVGMNSSGMNNMNSGMDMGMGSMGIDGMDMERYGHGMNDMGGLDITGVDFGQGQNRQGHHHPQVHQGDMPPPPPSSLAANQHQHRDDSQPLVPVTPASIMNLGRLGIPSGSGANGRLGASTSSSSTSMSSSKAASTSVPATTSTAGPTTNKKATRKETNSARGAASGTATRGSRVSTRKIVPAISPALKPLLPAGGVPAGGSPTSPNAAPTSPKTPHMSASMGGGAPGVRKTSHKAAEQKRRDSLKTTFDHLRKLLPPIALPNDADADPNLITSPLFHPTAPLLPGALPPRGPPKAGGEGPNKGVSKLQLLICGNEYIRLLKARVERRDDEIEKLRQEVARLRVVVEEKGGEDEGAMVGDNREAVDLNRDLDAVEKISVVAALGLRTGGGSGPGAGGQDVDKDDAGDDGLDEGDDEDD